MVLNHWRGIARRTPACPALHRGPLAERTRLPAAYMLPPPTSGHREVRSGSEGETEEFSGREEDEWGPA
ncbi:hypothetical protein NDU88_000246 [Pleurodeles waltl]|uniref:Uncharacterized protein n=1 Tax=Pleurodeles waltl TaxID=8319 RepID=A0AAV7N922_PLEWA|nr:hypothetical protein NDU88_000246 [Pleurodeles waltl]